MITTGLDQSLPIGTFLKYTCLYDTKKLYQSSGECDDEHQYKSIIESVMV